MRADEEVWGVPDRWQCQVTDDDGRRCVLGKNHRISAHMMRYCKTPEDSS